MECIEGALKTSLNGEAGFRQNLKGEFEDFVQNVATCDDDFVDDLLNFSNDDAEDDERLANDVVVLNDRESKRNDALIPGFDDSNNPPTELTVPADELANLEWLSHFVEDSFTATPFLSTGVSTEATGSVEPENPSSSEKPCFTTPVPAKARSKRTRTGGRVWSLGSPSFTESSSASTSSSSSSSPTSSWVMVVQSQEPAAAKKQKKKRAGTGSEATGPGLVRRCSHCGVQKTPQWRAGPLGAKTLCNACGVRFKSGRLFPEYRPACSPTFSSDLHSNHHRKVVEMRRKKESGPAVPLQPGFGHPVPSSFLL